MKTFYGNNVFNSPLRSFLCLLLWPGQRGHFNRKFSLYDQLPVDHLNAGTFVINTLLRNLKKEVFPEQSRKTSTSLTKLSCRCILSKVGSYNNMDFIVKFY